MGRLASARWVGRSPLAVPCLGLGQSALAGRVPSLSHLAGLLLPGWAAPLRTWAVRATAARWAAFVRAAGPAGSLCAWAAASRWASRCAPNRVRVDRPFQLLGCREPAGRVGRPGLALLLCFSFVNLVPF